MELTMNDETCGWVSPDGVCVNPTTPINELPACEYGWNDAGQCVQPIVDELPNTGADIGYVWVAVAVLIVGLLLVVRANLKRA